MKKIVYTLIFNRQQKRNGKEKAPLEISARLGQKTNYFSTQIHLYPEQWDNEKKIIKNHPNAEGLNKMIYEYMTRIKKMELELWERKRSISLDSLKNSLENIHENKSSFLSFYQKEVMDSSLTESTKKNHLSTYKILCLYKKNIYFSELSYAFILSFDHYLRTKGYHLNTIAKHMKHIKRYINIAINKEYMDTGNYIFRNYKIKTIEGHHTYLSPEELILFEKLRLERKYVRLQKTKDAFLFCCYTGLRYSDFISLTSMNIVEFHQNIWLIYKTIKTKQEVRVPLYLLFGGKAIRILERYGKDLNDFFKLRNNSNINKELILIAKLAGIKQRVSFHTARHTNATLLIYYGANITTVQKLLGHKNIRTTQTYTNIMDNTLIKDLEKISFTP